METYMTTQQQDIQIVDIEAELTRLWESRHEKDHIKACLCTLLVYADNRTRMVSLQQIVQSLIEKFPCRIIYILGDKAIQENYLHVTVSNAITGKGNVSIACDQISIDASMTQMSRVPFIVLPHLVPDLPIYLLWGVDPTKENDILPKLQKFATRLVFDSSCIDDIQAFSRRMLSLIDSQQKLDFMDINWARLHGWRQALSQVFDSPTKSEQLRLSKEIEIRFNDKKDQSFLHNEMQAIYLVGWLAAQMRWKFVFQEKGNEARILNYANGVNNFTVKLIPQINPNLQPGAILQVDVASTDDNFFNLSPMANLPKVMVHVSSLEKCELPFTVSLPQIKRGSSIIKAILYFETSAHYRHMLQSIGQIQ
jgi:glucose-6-phosphate dehydrogenase assembly protein OpcA